MVVMVKVVILMFSERASTCCLRDVTN